MIKTHWILKNDDDNDDEDEDDDDDDDDDDGDNISEYDDDGKIMS